MLEHRLCTLRWEFVRDRPAWRAADEAQPFLEVEIVDLIDDTVDVVGQGGAFRRHVAMEGEQLLNAMAQLRMRIGGETPRLEMFKCVGMRLGEALAGLAPGIGKEFERPLGCDRRIELAQ